jgi:leucyl aminopeptidase
VIVDALKGVKLSGAEFAANVAYGCQLRSYRFDKYRTKEKPEDKPSLATVAVMVKDVAGARRKFSPLKKIADGVFFTRDLVSEPANVLYPISFAARLRALSKLGVKLRVLDEKTRHGGTARRWSRECESISRRRYGMERSTESQE